MTRITRIYYDDGVLIEQEISLEDFYTDPTASIDERLHQLYCNMVAARIDAVTARVKEGRDA